MAPGFRAKRESHVLPKRLSSERIFEAHGIRMSQRMATQAPMPDDTILAAITAVRVAAMERFDRVETRLAQIDDDITVNLGRAERALVEKRLYTNRP
jgi:hypothetical protein